MSNLLIVHGGGPTTVLNASLYGAIIAAKQSEAIQHIYGALGGTAGFMAEEFIDFSDVEQEALELLKTTPGTAIGTSRTPLYEAEYKKMVEVLKKYNIKYVIFNGGNGTMDACGHLATYTANDGIAVMGIPKTIDNDLSETDHSPGFGSMAKYMAISVAEVTQDVRSMPIHVSIIEAMGRNVGWIAASSALARKNATDGPHMIMLPEVPFDEELFLIRVKQLHDQLGGVVIVASEGLKNADGSTIVPPIFKTERATYYGDVGSYLAELVIKKLGIKARSEKPGIIGRASIALQSEVDLDEAIMVGKAAVGALLDNISGKMVALERLTDDPYQSGVLFVDIEKVMLHEKAMPQDYYNPDTFDVTERFLDYCRPLIGKALPDYIYF